MMELTMKKYFILGISIFLSVESNCVPVTHTSNLTDLLHETTMQPAHERYHETETAFVSKHNATKTPNSSQKPAEINATAQTKTVVSPTIKSEEISIRKNSSQESRGSTAATVVTNPVAPTTTSSESQQNHVSKHSPVFSTAASHNANISEEEKSTEHLLPQQPEVTSATPASETTVVSLWQGGSTTKPQVTPKLSSASSTSQNDEKLHTPSTTNSETSPMFHTSSSLPVKITDTSTTRVDPPSTSKSISSTMAPISSSKFHGTTGSAASSKSANPIPPVSTNSETTASTSLTPGVLIPVNPKEPPTTKFTPATKTVPHEVSKSPSEGENHSCSTHSTAKQCLIAIASLAALATIFMVSTIILCTKLSSRKYRSKKQEQGTEMMCISSLLTERHYSNLKQRNPVRNGVLVIPSGGDSDEDGGDNLTLSSFLPENDRLV